jgi:hypothetical protein
MSMILISSSLLFSNSNLMSKPKKANVNEYITSNVNGKPCKLHVTGWVELKTVWAWPPVEITHYDLTIEGPCGKWRFVGSTGPNNEIVEGQLYDEKDNLISLDSNIIDIQNILLVLSTNLNED